MTEFLQITLGGIQVGVIYALIGLGFSLIYRVTNIVSLAQGAFCVLAALMTYSLQVDHGWQLSAAALAALIATAVISALFAVVAFVPGLQRLSHANMLMLTLGMLTIFEGLALVIWGSQPYAAPAFSSHSPLILGGVSMPVQGVWVIGSAFVIVGILGWALYRTSFGKALRACAQNPTAALLMGISVRRVQGMSFVIAALIGAVAGIVIAPTTSLQFDTGRLFTISGFIAVAIGGLGSLPGAIVGGLLLGVVEQLATAYLSSLYSNAIALALLLAVLVWRPMGLIRSGPSKRQDSAEEHRIWRRAVHLSPRGLVAGAMVGLVVLVLLPFVVGQGLVMSSLIIAGILYIALAGLDLLMGYAGQVSLGQAGFMAIGGYAAGYLVIQHGWSPLVGVLAGIVLSVVAALILSVVTLRLRGLYLALATLAFGLLIHSAAVGLNDITGGPSGMVGIPSFSIGSWDFGSPLAMYGLVASLGVLVTILLGGLARSGFGRALKAIRTDQTAAAALGIDVVRCKLIAFSISAGLASLAGSLYAFDFHFLSPDMVGTSRSIELVAMMVIGGEGTLIGPIFGATLLTLLPALFQPLAQWKTFADGALLMLCFLYLPEGIFGSVLHLVTWRPCRRRPASGMTNLVARS